jgi:hypothetical protein
MYLVRNMMYADPPLSHVYLQKSVSVIATSGPSFFGDDSLTI